MCRAPQTFREFYPGIELVETFRASVSLPQQPYPRRMSRLLDLSHTIESGTITYPGLPGPIISDHLTRAESRSHYEIGTEFQIGRIEMVANTGTYVDTPFHRFPDGYDLAGLGLEQTADLNGLCVPVEDQEIGPETVEGLDVAGQAVLSPQAGTGTGAPPAMETPSILSSLSRLRGCWRRMVLHWWASTR